MIEFTLKDGARVEATLADSHAGPGCCFDRQCVNHNVAFVRVDGGEWRRPLTRTLHRTVDWLAICETRDDVEAIFRPDAWYGEAPEVPS